MRDVSHSGVKCGRKKTVCGSHNITPLLVSEVPTEDSKISMWFFSHVEECDVIVLEGRIIADFFNKVL